MTILQKDLDWSIGFKAPKKNTKSSDKSQAPEEKPKYITGIEGENDTAKEKPDPEVRLISALWQEGPKGFLCKEKCYLLVSAEYLKETIRTKIKGQLFGVYGDEEVDLNQEVTGEIGKDNVAKMEIKHLWFINDEHYEEWKRKPYVECQYIVKSISHSRGENVIDSPILQLPQPTSYTCEAITWETQLFHSGSAIPCIDFAGELIDGLVTAFVHAHSFPQKEVVLFGHSDSVGNMAANYELSELRSSAVKTLLDNDENAWFAIAENKSKVEDYQQILKTLASVYGWSCDPGAVDNISGDKTKGAIEAFQAQYNRKFGESIGVEGIIGEQTWKALFKTVRSFIEKGAEKHLDTTQLPSFNYGHNGKGIYSCSSSFPVEGSSPEDPVNRRVEIVFFDEVKVPRLIDPPDRDLPVSVEENPVYDSELTEIKPIEKVQTGLKNSRGTVHFRFIYYNNIKKQYCSVPTNISISAYNSGNLSTSECYYNDEYGVHTLEIEDVAEGDLSGYHFGFNENRYIYTKDPDAELESVEDFAGTNERITPEELLKRPLNERLCYYDLPQEWNSLDWNCSRGNSEGDFQEVIRSDTSPAVPIIFCLDDIVLADENGAYAITDKDNEDNPKSLDGDSRVSLFYVNNGKLDLYAPENSKAPFFSRIPFSRNYIAKPPGRGLVVAFANDFYTIGNRRATLAAGFPAGARVAAKRATEQHFGEVLDDQNNPFGHQRFFARGTGNFELHYFHEAGISSRNGVAIPRSFLLVYWSARFQFDPDEITLDESNPDEPIILPPVTTAQVRTFETEGMMNSKIRWEDKGYTIEPNDPSSPPHEIIPVFFFESKKPLSGGREKCVVNVSNNPRTGWMGNRISEMYFDDYKDRDTWGEARDIDGKRYISLVVAHEYGHATGKDDEYSYDGGDISRNARNSEDGPFTQWYLGMPYRVDEDSMMVTNRAPRMRQYWFFVNWLNECSMQSNKLRELLGGRQYKIVHRFSGRELNFFLPGTAPHDYRDIYKPAFFQRNLPTVAGGANSSRVDVALYKIGQDETAYELEIPGHTPTEPWDSICVVYLKIALVFENLPPNLIQRILNQSPVRWEDRVPGKPPIVLPDGRVVYLTYKSLWLDEFNERIELLKQTPRFWAVDSNPSNRHFRNTYIHFFPVVLENPVIDIIPSATPGGSETRIPVDITAFANTIIKIRMDHDTRVARNGATITAGSNTSITWLVRYLVGGDDGAAAPTANTNIIINDLRFLERWLRNSLNSPSLNIQET
ncbi:hypothetical protein CHISP_2568 [Chitinispirillum alkaliphilum]|nr:hypothetical protein CHISP_2568 [Chitinispirillum alkaliphilum]